MNCKVYAAVPLLMLLVSSTSIFSTAYAGPFEKYPYPFLARVEIYKVSVGCSGPDANDPPAKNLSVRLINTTDLTIRDTIGYCGTTTFDLSTTCEEDLSVYIDVISNTGMCEIRLISDHYGGAGIDALCRGGRNPVVDMIYELCTIMMEVE